MTAADAFPFVMLGAVIGLDVVSFPQAMFSRPLVAATLAGAFAGDAERGLVLGAVLEMVALGTLPFGASRYPDWGSASVVGGALYASGASAPTGHLALAVLATLLAAWVSGESMVVLRKLNAQWAHAAQRDPARGPRVTSLQLRGLVGDLVRGGLVTGISLALLAPAYAVLAAQWSGSSTAERAVLSGLTAALGGATVWMLVRGTPGTRLLVLAGLVVGLALVLS